MIDYILLPLFRFFKSYQVRKRRNIDKKPPKFDLEKKHTKNAELLRDRNSLLSFMPKNSVVAEIGVHKGDFAENILDISEPRELHLIDKWAQKKFEAFTRSRFSDHIKTGKVIIHKGLSVDELQKFEDGFFDWVYLDSNHSYENVNRELSICKTKVRKGGIIAGHDYTVGEWVGLGNWLYGGIRYGVIEAVNQFCVQNDWEFLYLTNERHRYLSFALREIN